MVFAVLPGPLESLHLRAVRIARHAGPSTLRSLLIRQRLPALGPDLVRSYTSDGRSQTQESDGSSNKFLAGIDTDDSGSAAPSASSPRSPSESAASARLPDVADEIDEPDEPDAPQMTHVTGRYEATGRSFNLKPRIEDGSFDDAARELIRRQRRTEAKRTQRGAFLDHLIIHVRGGRGGHGATAFSMTQKGSLGPPSGGYGGPGGTVYLKTSPTLTSLHTLPRRITGAPGSHGKGDTINGRPGEDTVIEVPVGTVVREVRREADKGAKYARPESLDEPTKPQRQQFSGVSEDLGEGDGRNRSRRDSFGLPQDESDNDESRPLSRVKVKEEPITEEEKQYWDRIFVLFPGAEFTKEEYKRAERVLKRGGRAEKPPPSFDFRAPLLHDLEEQIDEPIILARGGAGGVGNPFFSGFSGYRQPRLASKGLIPYTSTFELELKILADVGLVGFPNVGKSTILRALTGRRAEVANYSFTTLNPQVGVVRVFNDGTFGGGSGDDGGDGYDGGEGTGGANGSENGNGFVVEETWKERDLDTRARLRGEYRPLPRSERIRHETTSDDGLVEKHEISRFTISDNPGLLPLASENVGLGHSFLRSIERSLALAYVVDITRPDPAGDLMALRQELDAYKDGLTGKGTVVILNKGDEVDEGVGREKMDSVKRVVEGLPERETLSVVVLSGKFGLGLSKVVRRFGERVEEEREKLRVEKAMEGDV